MVLMIFLLIYESSVNFFKDFFLYKGINLKTQKRSFIFIRQKAASSKL